MDRQRTLQIRHTNVLTLYLVMTEMNNNNI